MSYTDGYNQIMHSSGLEKVAREGLVRRGWEGLKNSFGRLKDAPEELATVRKTHRDAGNVKRQLDAPHLESDKLQKIHNSRSGKGLTDAERNTAGNIYDKNRKSLKNHKQERLQELRSSRNDRLKQYGKDIAPAVGATAAGASVVGGGAAAMYGSRPADTRTNKLKQLSNQNLGTDFSQQSRFNHWRNS